MKSGEILYSGYNLTSLNGQYILAMQQDGHLCIYQKGDTKSKWCSGVYPGPGEYQLVMQIDGNVCV